MVEESSLAFLPFLICSSLYLGLNILTTYNDLISQQQSIPSFLILLFPI